MILRSVLIVLATAILAGCASPAKMENMVVSASPESSVENPAILESVCVTRVSGGKQTNPMRTSEVDDAGFLAALKTSLQNNRLAAPEPARCKYELEATLMSLVQPILGPELILNFNMTVTSNVKYDVTERATGSPYFSTAVSAPYTAKFGDALIGGERLRLANEGSIRENIKRFIAQLNAFKPS